jgi:Ulp1 family protease
MKNFDKNVDFSLEILEIPQQNDSYNCGINVCEFSRLIKQYGIGMIFK